MHVYSDASHYGHRGAWTFIVVKPDVSAPITANRDGAYTGAIHHIAFGLHEIDIRGHSSYFELVAAANALRYMAKNYPNRAVTLISDSTYVVHGCEDLMSKWRKMAAKPIRNSLDTRIIKLWADIVRSVEQLGTFKAVHVKGHNGDTFNTACDKICTYISRNKVGAKVLDGINHDTLMKWIFTRKVGANRHPPVGTTGNAHWYQHVPAIA